MAESPNARRERIAETIYAAMLGSSEWCDNTNAVLAHEARKAADTFLSSAPEQPQPQPPADASPSLLGMAKLIVGIDWAALFRQAWCDDHHAGQVPPVVAAAIDNLRDAIEREEARG